MNKMKKMMNGLVFGLKAGWISQKAIWSLGGFTRVFMITNYMFGILFYWMLIKAICNGLNGVAYSTEVWMAIVSFIVPMVTGAIWGKKVLKRLVESEKFGTDFGSVIGQTLRRGEFNTVKCL